MSNHSAFLRNNDLKLYRITNGYLLVSKDDEVLMSFEENTSYTSTSMRHSVHKHAFSSGLVLAFQAYTHLCPIEITNFDDIDVSLLDFINQCYSTSIDYKVKGDAFSERARALQKKYGIPYEVCKMLAQLHNGKAIDKAVEAIKDARLYGINHSNAFGFAISLSEVSSKREKREAFRRLLGEEVYKSLQLETRGKEYLNALAEHISSNLPELIDDFAGAFTSERNDFDSEMNDSIFDNPLTFEDEEAVLSDDDMECFRYRDECYDIPELYPFSNLEGLSDC